MTADPTIADLARLRELPWRGPVRVEAYDHGSNIDGDPCTATYMVLDASTPPTILHHSANSSLAYAIAAALNALPALTDAAEERDRLRVALAEAEAAVARWQPTADAINALPAPIRQYIHDLETMADARAESAETWRESKRLAASLTKEAEMSQYDEFESAALRYVSQLKEHGVAAARIEREHLATLAVADAISSTGWRCFHCDAVFTERHRAADHFGPSEHSLAACQIKAGAEGSMVTALRNAERAAESAQAAIHAESTDAAKAYYAQADRHREQLRVVEEHAYERGLADGRAEQITAEQQRDRALAALRAQCWEHADNSCRDWCASCREGAALREAALADAAPTTGAQ